MKSHKIIIECEQHFKTLIMSNGINLLLGTGNFEMYQSGFAGS